MDQLTSVQGDDGFGAYRRLGRAVIVRAAVDAHGVVGSQLTRQQRDDARTFLARGPSLEFWCTVAGLSLRHIQEEARRRNPEA